MVAELTKADFEKILANYDIGRYRKSRHIFSAGNLIFQLLTTKKLYLLKSYGSSSSKFIKFQADLLRYLYESGVSVPEVILTKGGDDLLVYDGRNIEIQEFVRGRQVLYLNEELARDLGRKMGILSRALMKFKRRPPKEPGKKHPQMFAPWKIKELCGVNLIGETEKLFAEIRKLNKNKLRRSLIHGDICEGNFMVRGSKILSIIDWEGMHKDFIVHEIAVLLAHNLSTKRSARRELIRLFLREYQKYIKLNDEEKRALYLFVKHRALGGCSWSIEQAFKHKSKRKMFMRWAVHCLRRYQSFNRITLEEFLDLARI